jgi:hypothetical protein
VISLTKSLAEVASWGSGERRLPGIIETEMIEKLDDRVKKEFWDGSP